MQLVSQKQAAEDVQGRRREKAEGNWGREKKNTGNNRGSEKAFKEMWAAEILA